MNLIEFIFAVACVFGSTGVILAWNSFVYKIEQREQESKQDMFKIIE